MGPAFKALVAPTQAVCAFSRHLLEPLTPNYFRDQSLAACEYCKPGGNGFTTLGPGAEPKAG
jgi:hypothetical protein